MSYPTLPGRRLPYDVDGTVVKTRTPTSSTVNFAAGTTGAVLTSGQMVELNDEDLVSTARTELKSGASGTSYLWFFFPELRRLTGATFATITTIAAGSRAVVIEGSPDTTNGVDGTWYAATFPSGAPVSSDQSADGWRAKALDIALPYDVVAVRVALTTTSGVAADEWTTAHLYGAKAAGATPDDLVFLQYFDFFGFYANYVEYTLDEDFEERGSATTEVRQFRIQNISPALTALDIVLTLDHTDFVLGESASGPWATTINIGALGPGVESATFYIRNTTPVFGGGPTVPQAARISAVAGSWVLL